MTHRVCLRKWSGRGRLFCAGLLVLLTTAAWAKDPGCSPEVAAARRAVISAGRAVVSAPVVDLYERADQNGPVADQARLGELVTLVPQPEACAQKSDQLVLVETTAAYRGYVLLSQLVPWQKDQLAASAAPAQAGTPLAAGTRLRVSSRLANLFRSPDVTLANPRFVLPLHTELRLVEAQSPRWLKVALPDGTAGFVQRGDVDVITQETRPPVSCFLQEARKYEGTPYLWGGRSTLGIDCSGLVASAFFACGVTAPRDAGPQMTWADMLPVESQSTLKPGDLVFFRSGEPANASSMNVAHVGIFVGEGRFFHATTSDRPTVHESNLGEPQWQRRYLGARRHRSF